MTGIYSNCVPGCHRSLVRWKSYPCNLTLYYDGCQLATTKKLDILRVTIDSKLSWSKHLPNISIRAGQKLGALRRVASKLNTKSRAIIYKAHVCSDMEYTSLSWINAPPTHLSLLDNIQKKALKVICVEQDTAPTQLTIPSLHRDDRLLLLQPCTKCTPPLPHGPPSYAPPTIYQTAYYLHMHSHARPCSHPPSQRSMLPRQKIPLSLLWV